MAVTLLLIIGMGVELLRSSLLWMAASFGFILPITLLLAAFYQGQKALERNVWSPTSLILAFLAGATTEQFGLVSLIVFTGMACFLSATEGKKAPNFCPTCFDVSRLSHCIAGTGNS